MSATDTREQYLLWRKRFVVRLALFHFILILIFDSLAIFAPTLMSGSVFADGLLSKGVTLAFLIVFSVIFSTFYYSHMLNKKERELHDAQS